MEYLRYLQEMDKVAGKEQDIGPVALDILEIFVHNESLSAYQIFSKVKSTHLKMAYKNIHKRIQRLQSLGVIKEIKKNTENRAKYYQLTEYGIFQLFLKRLGGVVYNNLRSEKEPGLWFTKDIFEYYGDSLLFRIFLYPYVDKKTVLNLGIDMSINFYNYLRECCRAVDEVLTLRKREPLVKKYRILKHLQEVFDIEKVNHKNITIRLDRERKRAVVKYNEPNKRTVAKYEIDDIGDDILLLSRETLEELAKNVFGTKMLLERLVFEIIFSLAKSHRKENVETLKNLSSDQKFMRLINDFHNTYEKGYSTIMESKHWPKTYP